MTLPLEDMELIRQVTYRYFRSVDTGDFDAVEACFTEDASVAFIGGSYRFEQEGRARILTTLRTILNGGVAAMHTVHHPEITVLTETTAEGTWYLTDWAINLEHKVVTHGACLVRNQYRKVGGEWKIRHYGYTRIYEPVDQLEALPRITAHALADAAATGKAPHDRLRGRALGPPPIDRRHCSGRVVRLKLFPVVSPAWADNRRGSARASSPSSRPAARARW